MALQDACFNNAGKIRVNYGNTYSVLCSEGFAVNQFGVLRVDFNKIASSKREMLLEAKDALQKLKYSRPDVFNRLQKTVLEQYPRAKFLANNVMSPNLENHQYSWPQLIVLPTQGINTLIQKGLAYEVPETRFFGEGVDPEEGYFIPGQHPKYLISPAAALVLAGETLELV